MTSNTQNKDGNSRSGISPAVVGGVVVAAVVIVAGLIFLGGGFASPSEPVPTLEPPPTAGPVADDVAALGGPLAVDELVDCGGVPCPAMGDESAPVTMIEVSDFACPHCRDHNLEIAPLLQEEFVDTGKVRLVSHVFANAPTTAFLTSAALCANEQGKYFEFQHEAFNDDLGLRGADMRDGIAEVGERIGLDSDSFLACVEEARYLAQVQQSTIDARRANVLFTPTFIVNGLMIEGGQPISLFRTKIQQAIEKHEQGN